MTPAEIIALGTVAIQLWNMYGSQKAAKPPEEQAEIDAEIEKVKQIQGAVPPKF